MKTTRYRQTFETSLTAADRRFLVKMLAVLGQHTKLRRVGTYKKISSSDIWRMLVSQVCVMGGSNPIEKISRDPKRVAEFKQATSIRTLQKRPRLRDYLAKTLRSFKATRFHNLAADRIVALLRSPTVVRSGSVLLLKGLSHKDDPLTLRDTLIERCPQFRLKSASDFMIDIGLSRDVAALDTRIVGVLHRYLGYRMKPEKIQANRALYFSVEQALREVCVDAKSSLGILDRTLFQFSGMRVLEMMQKHPKAFRR